MTSRGAYKPRKRISKPKTLGERIQWWRRAFKMSQRDLAHAIRVTQQTISSWENDLITPSGPGLEQLLRVMGVSEQALFKGDGFQVPEEPWLGRQGALDPGGAGDLVVKEDGSQKTLILPTAAVGEAWGVVVDEGGRRDRLTQEQALEWVEQAFSDQQSVWIVVRSKKKRKPRLPKRAK